MNRVIRVPVFDDSDRGLRPRYPRHNEAEYAFRFEGLKRSLAQFIPAPSFGTDTLCIGSITVDLHFEEQV